LERSHTNKLTAHLKALEQKEANTPRRSRRQEIVKLRAEINQLETKRMIKESAKSRAGSLKKNQQGK
jgi:cell division protein FtsB